MSAAEPADPTRTRTLNTGAVGAVIDITKRRRGGAHAAAQGRWKSMGTSPRHNPDPHEPSALELFADDIETSFNSINQSLTDPRTAAAFLKTLDIWQRALEGSHATGLITSEQLDELVTVIRGMREAPRLV